MFLRFSDDQNQEHFIPVNRVIDLIVNADATAASLQVLSTEKSYFLVSVHPESITGLRNQMKMLVVGHE